MLTLLLVVSVAVVAVVAVAELTSPYLRHRYDLNAIAPRGMTTELPAVGAGPVERVVGVDRTTAGEVWGTDLATGARIVRFDPEDVERIGDSDYTLSRSGYDQAPRTLMLTFDDGPDAVTTRQLLDVLGQEHVPATFFMQGKFVARNPDLVRRMVAEGHAVGGHTVNHPHLEEVPRWRERYEVITTERLIRAVAGVSTDLWRMPYDDGEDADGHQSIGALLLGQQLGYEHIGYDFDTQDWAIVPRPGAQPSDIALPDFESGQSMTVLMHDAGGPNRELTVAYVRDRLIPAARANGYTFAAVPQASSQVATTNHPVEASLLDRGVLVSTRAIYDWPTAVMRGLFISTVVLAFALGLGNALLAVLRHHRRRRETWPAPTDGSVLPVTVLLAAYNEETVIERTIRSVLASDYPVLEVLVVDDGSTDATASIVARLAQEDPRVRLVRQPNGGKSAALNNGIACLRGDIVVTIDADTQVVPETIGRLVRRFVADTEGRLGVVAGVVRVGNRNTNILTRWQALEYVSQIGVDRAAQSMVNGIAIVPGACAAWRRSALLASGGFKNDNLAEDADLALTMHELDLRVEQDDEAYAFTEAPETLDDLIKQRIRWTYGIMQAMWKHRRLLFNPRHPGIGFYVLPNYVLSLLVPLLLLPLTIVMTVVAVQNEGPALLAVSFGVFVLYQLVLSGIAVLLMDEDPAHLVMVPMYRVIFEPLRAYLLYSTVLSALKGVRVRWNHLTRTGSVNLRVDRPTAPVERPPVESVGILATSGGQQ